MSKTINRSATFKIRKKLYVQVFVKRNCVGTVSAYCSSKWYSVYKWINTCVCMCENSVHWYKLIDLTTRHYKAHSKNVLLFTCSLIIAVLRRLWGRRTQHKVRRVGMSHRPQQAVWRTVPPVLIPVQLVHYCVIFGWYSVTTYDSHVSLL